MWTDLLAPSRPTSRLWTARHGELLRGVLGGMFVALWVSLLGFGVLWAISEVTPFHRDERSYLQRARFFSYLFVERDLRGRRWGDSEATHTQPMLANYVVGGWLWANGHDVTDIQVLIPEQRRPGEDRSLPRRYYPDMELLIQARRPMLVFGAGVIALLYLLGRALGGWVAGLVAAALALLSPLAQEYLTVVRSEAPLLCFSLLGLLLGFEAARRYRDGRLPLGWALALGLALGLALATKLTAALSLAAVATWGLLMAAQAAWHRPAGRLGAAWRAGRGWALSLLVAGGVFVASNPHLYPDPLLHSRHLFENRAEAMERQQGERPAQAIENPLERPGRLLAGSLVESAGAGSRGVPLEAPLAALGLAVLGWRIWQGWRREQRLAPEAWVILVVLVYYAGTSLALSIVWPRYFLPTLLLGTLLCGVGVGAIWPALRAAARSVKPAEPLPCPRP